ncbi:MAG: hypothetical protein KAJ95_09925 [Gammaproteobacteria bacterium]|nr:hypothetical protein [Gammaproteobacteria bacterium]
MPIDHDILNGGDLVISTVSGVLTGDELADHMFWLINQFGTTLNAGYQQIFDCLNAVRLDIVDEDLKRISQIILTYGQDRGKIATALVATDPDFRKMAFYYKSLSEMTDIVVDVFSSRQESEKWLQELIK